MRESDNLLQNYVESLLPVQSETLKKIAHKLKEDDKWGINIGPLEGCLLQFFIKSFGVKKILEIGTQYGYSTQWMLEALPQDGVIHTLEKDTTHFEIAKKHIADHRVAFHLGDAKEILTQLDAVAPFDLIFIDANKKAYPDYLSWSVKNIKKGGLIIGDNTFLFGSVLSAETPKDISPGLWKAMREFNHTLFTHSEFQVCIVPTSEGMTVAIKK